MKKFFLFASLLFLFVFVQDVHADYQNNYTTFSIEQDKLGNNFLTYSQGIHKLSFSGGIIYPIGESYDAMSSKNMYINLNLCMETEIGIWSDPENAYNIYIHKTGVTCSYNNSPVKGEVVMLYFRTYIEPKSLVYDGSFYVNFKEVSSVQFINYYASPNGFLNYQTMDYTEDLNQIKEALGAIKTKDLQDVIENKFDETNEKIEETNKNLKDLNDTMKDNDTSGSQNQAGGFFGGFSSSDYGLSDIITMPLTFIQGLSNNTCYSLSVPLPFVDQNVNLPCMTSIYQQHFGSFLTLYQTITTGIIAYWVCVNLFRLVQGFKNPDKDEIEVMDL